VTRRWPDSLPNPVGRGYTLELADTARRTEFEVAVRARRITTVRRDRPTLAARLTDPEFAAFRAWWGDEPWSLTGASDTIADWTLTGAAADSGAAIGPDQVPCDILVEDAAESEHRAQQALAEPGWAPGDRAAAVVSLLPIGRNEARIGLVGRDNTHRHVTVDLAARTITGLSGGVEATLAPLGAWTRGGLRARVGSGASAVRLRIGALASGAVSYVGSGTAAFGIGQVNARRGGFEACVFVPCGPTGAALGTAGGSAWFFCPIAVGGGVVRREVLPLARASTEPRPSLAWQIGFPVEARDA
jgi:hypothetical protein